MFANAEPIEVAWTLFGLVALIVNGAILAEACHEWRVSYMKPPNPKRRLIATSAVLLHGGLTTKQIIVVLIGLVAMATPSAREGAGYSFLGLLFIVGLFVNEIIAATIGLVARFFRGRLDGALDAEDATISAVLTGQEHDRDMQDREDARAARHEDRQDIRAALGASEDRADSRAERREDRQDARDQAHADQAVQVDDRRDERERNRT